MPDELHWFKWEAYFTWISGFSLLVLVYYFGAETFLIDPAKAALSVPGAIGLGLLALALGWLVYDGLCRSPLAATTVCSAWSGSLCLVGAGLRCWTVCSPSRARLSPCRRDDRHGDGRQCVLRHHPQPAQGGRRRCWPAARPIRRWAQAAKQRSLHNNYMTLPVLFIMISNHYPMTYGAQRPWLVLALLGATGVAVRHVFNLRHRDRAIPLRRWRSRACWRWPASAMSRLEKARPTPPSRRGRRAASVGWADVAAAVRPALHRLPQPAPDQPAPLPRRRSGSMLDSYAHARAVAPRIRRVAVDAQIMPLGNTTGMTPAERAKLGAWIAQGTPQ